MSSDTTKIDPEVELQGEFSRLTLGVTAQIKKMRQTAIFTDGVLPSKHKALAATLWAISARCEPCIEYYVQQAAKFGASEKEVGEFLAIAPTMGGCVGETWALKAYRFYKDFKRGASPEAPDPGSCCK
jgi:AhpD family alkylhydroperoxidase